MSKKQLRTVKKSSQTGRLDRAAVRAAVIAARDCKPEDGVNPGAVPSAYDSTRSRLAPSLAAHT